MSMMDDWDHGGDSMMGGMDHDQIRVHDLEEQPSEEESEGDGDGDGAGDGKGVGGGDDKGDEDAGEEDDDDDDKEGGDDDDDKKSGEEESGSGSEESGSEESGSDESGSEESGSEESEAGEGAASIPADVEKPLLTQDLQEGFALREDYTELYGNESQVPLWATDEAGTNAGGVRRGSSGGEGTPGKARRPSSGVLAPPDLGAMGAMDALLAAATGERNEPKEKKEEKEEKEVPKKKRKTTDERTWEKAARDVPEEEHVHWQSDTIKWVNKLFLKVTPPVSHKQVAQRSGVPLDCFTEWLKGDPDPRVTSQLRRCTLNPKP